MKNKFLYQFIIVVSLFVFVYTALQSEGYHHPDEHFQIIEYTRVLNGDQSHLAWEYHERIRPSTQVYIAQGAFSSFRFFGVDNAYALATILRVFSALICFLGLLYFYNVFKKFFDRQPIRVVFLIATMFLWFLPYISARFSSETWSGISFLLGLTIYHDRSFKLNKYLFVGLLMGLSVVFRLQSVVMVGVFFLWSALVRKDSIKSVFIYALAALSMVTLNTVLDTLFYGEFTFSPWRYFEVNFLEDKASSFGVSPWSYYFKMIYQQTFWPIGILIYLGMVALLLRKPKSVILWSCLFFIAAHSYIPHKELRFIFPVAFLAPFIITYGINEIYKLICHQSVLKKFSVVVLSAIFIINGLGLVVMVSKPAGSGLPMISRKIQAFTNQEGKLNILYTEKSNPSNPWGVPLLFYKNEKANYINIHDLCQINEENIALHQADYIVIRKAEIKDSPCANEFQSQNHTLVKQTTPPWILETARDFYLKTDPVFILYRVE